MVLGLAALALVGIATWWSSPLEAPVLDSEGRLLHFPRLRDMVYAADDHGGLLIDRFEVTDGEYEEFVRATGYHLELRGDRNDPSASDDEPRPRTFLRHWLLEDGRLRPVERNTPVRFVDREDCVAYARWRGKQVPTTEQWLLASPLMQRHRYPWYRLDAVEEACNTHEFGWNGVCPVGVFANGRSETSCFDLIGNVAEWTLGEHGGSQLARVMGGSFNTVLPATGRRGAEVGLEPAGTELAAIGARPVANERNKGDPAPFDIRNGELLDPAERVWDVGFRCVIPQADRVIKDSLEVIAGLSGEMRSEAVREILAVGVYLMRRDRNKVLPFVSEREFLSRIRWSIEVDLPPTLLRSPVPLDDDPHEDLLVLFGDQLQARSGRDGSLIRSHSWPEPGVDVELVRGAESPEWLCCERSNHELRLLDLTTFEELVLPPPPREPTQSVLVEVRDLPAGRGRLAIQSLDYADIDTDPLAVRLQLVSENGETEALELPGDFKSFALLDEDTALVCSEEYFLLEIHEPFRATETRLAPVVALTCSVVQLGPLRCLARHRLAPEPKREAEQYEQSTGMARERPFFIGPAGPKEGKVLVAVAGKLSGRKESEPSRWEAVSEWFDLRLLETPSLKVLDTDRWSAPPSSSLLPAGLPGVWLGLGSGFSPVVFEAVEGKIRRTDLESADLRTDSLKREWWLEGDVSVVEPYLVDILEGGGLEVRRLERSERGQWSLSPLLPHAPERGQLKSSLLVTGAESRILLRHELSDVYCIDPGLGDTLWQVRRWPPAEGPELKIEPFDRATHRSVLVGKKATDLWIRSMEDGHLVDHLQTRRPIDGYELLDVTGDGEREWVLEFDPGFAELLSLEGDDGYRVVALAPPDPDSPEHRLLLEFREVAENERVRADPGRDW